MHIQYVWCWEYQASLANEVSKRYSWGRDSLNRMGIKPTTRLFWVRPDWCAFHGWQKWHLWWQSPGYLFLSVQVPNKWTCSEIHCDKMVWEFNLYHMCQTWGGLQWNWVWPPWPIWYMYKMFCYLHKILYHCVGQAMNFLTTDYRV